MWFQGAGFTAGLPDSREGTVAQAPGRGSHPGVTPNISVRVQGSTHLGHATLAAPWCAGACCSPHRLPSVLLISRSSFSSGLAGSFRCRDNRLQGQPRSGRSGCALFIGKY